MRVDKNYGLFMKNCHTPLSINLDLMNFTVSKLCCIYSLKQYRAFNNSLRTIIKPCNEETVLIWCSSDKFCPVIMGMVATVLLNVLNSCGHNDSYSTVSLIDFKIGDYYSNGRSEGNPLDIHNTGSFEMTVGFLTTCHTQYT
jgi:hypothetical protein